MKGTHATHAAHDFVQNEEGTIFITYALHGYYHIGMVR